MGDKNYLCIIGDLVDSKKISGRSAFQKRLQRVIAQINRRQHAVSPWTLTLGDEFQVVYDIEVGVWQDLLSLIAELWPQRIRFAIAVGPLFTAINRKQALGMDGPAFHRAREIIQQMKKEGGRIGIDAADPAKSEKALAIIASLAGKLLYNGRTATRTRIFQGMLAGQSGTEIAKANGISASAVSQQIETAALEDLVSGARLIEAFWKRNLNPQ